jgi:hypothetical protein
MPYLVQSAEGSSEKENRTQVLKKKMEGHSSDVKNLFKISYCKK